MAQQSRRMSFIEAAVSTVIGYVVAFGGQLVIFPLMGIRASIMDNVVIGLIFTVISLVRSYLVRRMFNTFR